jgi:uncharacterized protein YdcH (DUF465 family)
MEELKINIALLKAILPDVSDELLTKAVTTVNNYVIGQAEPLISKEKGKVKGETLQLIDDMAKEVDGNRGENEKSTDFVKRVITELKTKESNATAKITELEKKINDGSLDNTLKEQLKSITEQKDALVKELKDIKVSHKEELTKVTSESEKAFKEVAFRAAAPKLKAGILSPDAEKTMIDLAIREYLDSSERVNGVIILKDKEGKILRNPDNNHEPYTITELLAKSKLLEGLVETKVIAGGTGKPPVAPPKAGDKTPVNVSSYSGFKSKDELTKALKEEYKGKTDDPEYYEKYQEAVKQFDLK